MIPMSRFINLVRPKKMLGGVSPRVLFGGSVRSAQSPTLSLRRGVVNSPTIELKVPVVRPVIVFSNPIVQKSTRSEWSAGKMLALLSSTGLGAGVLSQSFEEPYQTETLDELNAKKMQLIELLGEQAKSLGCVDDAMEISFAINKCISGEYDEKAGEKFKSLLQDLFSLIKNPSEAYLSLLVHTCAVQGNVSLLEAMLAYPQLTSVIQKNRDAKKLLEHPAKRTIAELACQFNQGLGHIEDTGANVQLAHAYESDRGRLLERLSFEGTGITGLDDIGEASLFLSFLRDQQEARKTLGKIDSLYENVVILETLQQDDFKKYLMGLKSLCDRQEKPVTGIFLLYGDHYTCGQIEISKTSSNKYMIKTCHIDSIGGDADLNPHYYLLHPLRDVFPEEETEELKIYVSEEHIQHDKKSCAVYALMAVEDLIWLDETLALYPQYSDLPIENKLFAYLEKYVTQSVQNASTTDDEGNTIHYEYSTALLPLIFVQGKQSLTRDGKVKLASGEEKIVVGKKGLTGEIDASPKARQDEVHYPARAYRPESVGGHITRFFQPNKEGKRQNRATLLKVFEWAVELPKWLATKSEEEVHGYERAFSCEQFQSKVKARIEEIDQDDLKERNDEQPSSITPKQ